MELTREQREEEEEKSSKMRKKEANRKKKEKEKERKARRSRARSFEIPARAQRILRRAEAAKEEEAALETSSPCLFVFRDLKFDRRGSKR